MQAFVYIYIYLDSTFGGRGPTTLVGRLLRLPAGAADDSRHRFPGHRGRDRFRPDRNSSRRPGGSGAMRAGGGGGGSTGAG